MDSCQSHGPMGHGTRLTHSSPQVSVYEQVDMPPPVLTKTYPFHTTLHTYIHTHIYPPPLSPPTLGPELVAHAENTLICWDDDTPPPPPGETLFRPPGGDPAARGEDMLAVLRTVLTALFRQRESAGSFWGTPCGARRCARVGTRSCEGAA